MLSTTRHFIKEYIERAVQTDPLPFKTPHAEIPTSSLMDSPSHSHVVDTCSLSAPSPPPPGRVRTATQDESAYSQCQTDISFDSTSSTADRSMTTTTRALNMEPISFNRPTTLFDRQMSCRTVSLPEATPKFRMKTVLEKKTKTTRVVSMPTSAFRDPLSEGLDAQSIVGDPFVSEDEQHTRVRVRSHATDVPHAPSIPSSPDSVVIIANTSNQLSNEFLKPQIEEESALESGEEDWITWTQSPPRPIPALHGPLSLPYARCPSGAEGTIIEEPDSLPRVIWGLDSDDLNGRTQLRATNVQSLTGKPPAETAAEKGRTGTKTRITEDRRAPFVQTIQPPSVLPSGRPMQDQQSSTTSDGSQELQRPPEFILKHSEPIDLGRLLGYSLEKIPLEVVRDGVPSSMGWQASYSNDLPTPELVHDLSPDMAFAQDRFKNHGLTTPCGSASGIHGLSSASVPASLPSGSPLESLKSSRSPILLEELAPQHLAYPEGPMLRTSALDIAQKYRQQHLRSSLPTPPDSTSPIWSTAFSPYQGGMLSPELLAAAGLSQMKASYVPSQVVPPRLESSQHLLRPVPNGFSKSSLGTTWKPVFGSLSPATLVNGQKLPPRLAAEYARRRTMPDTFPDSSQLQNEVDVQYLSPVRETSYSPRLPNAPPNTPYASVSPYGSRYLDAVAITQPSFLDAPPSPTVARELQNINLSQHIRSVPLSRLVQRRLSTVPEEDCTSSADTGTRQTAPTSGRGIAQGPTTSASGLHLFLSPSGRANVSAAHSDLLGDHVGARYGAGDMGVSADPAHTIPYGVKLPGAAQGKGPGPVAGREAHFVREASRRQGTGNINNDGRKRGEGGRGRGYKRGGRGRKGRSGGNAHGVHGTERVDGGMVVKS